MEPTQSSSIDLLKKNHHPFTCSWGPAQQTSWARHANTEFVYRSK
jgi:hypothetical protein